MNPFGILIVALGAVVIWVGIRGTQKSLYADIFGHDYPTNSGATSAPILGSNSASTGAAGGLSVPGSGNPYAGPGTGGNPMPLTPGGSNPQSSGIWSLQI